MHPVTQRWARLKQRQQYVGGLMTRQDGTEGDRYTEELTGLLSAHFSTRLKNFSVEPWYPFCSYSSSTVVNSSYTMAFNSALPIVCKDRMTKVNKLIYCLCVCVCACAASICVYLDLLQQPLYDAQQDVPRDHLQLFAVLFDQPGDGEDDFIGHHLIGTRHGLRGRDQTITVTTTDHFTFTASRLVMVLPATH